MKAIQFDGTFELDFLRDGEQVRSAGKGTDAIEILNRNDEVVVVVKKGQWICRDEIFGLCIMVDAPRQS